MVFEHFENGGDIPTKFVHEKKRFVISMNPTEFIEQVLIFLKDNFQK